MSDEMKELAGVAAGVKGLKDAARATSLNLQANLARGVELINRVDRVNTAISEANKEVEAALREFTNDPDAG